MDYMPLSDFQIRWLADQVDPSYTTGLDPAFVVTIINDDIPEPREYFEIELTLSPTGNDSNGFFYPRAVGRVTIIDDDIRKYLYVCSPICTVAKSIVYS